MPRPVARPILVSIGIGAMGVAVSVGSWFFADLLLGDPTPWPMFVGGLAAAAVFSLTPKRGIGLVVAIVAALVFSIVPYLDGDDACNGKPSCEDNLGPALRILFTALLLGVPALIGEVAGAFVRPRAWHHLNPPDAAEPPHV